MAGLQPEAERAGFEPATDLSARTRFPVALLRPLGHLSEPAQRIGLAASGQLFEVVVALEVELRPITARRAHDVEPMALLESLSRLFDRPEIVVHDRVAVGRIAQRLRMTVSAADDADDAVLGDCYFPSAAGAKSP